MVRNAYADGADKAAKFSAVQRVHSFSATNASHQIFPIPTSRRLRRLLVGSASLATLKF